MRFAINVAAVVALAGGFACGHGAESSTQGSAGSAGSAGQPHVPTRRAAPTVDRANHPAVVTDQMLDTIDRRLAAWNTLSLDLMAVGSDDCAKAAAVVERDTPMLLHATEGAEGLELAAKDPAFDGWLKTAFSPRLREAMDDGGVFKQCNVVKKDEAFTKAFVKLL